MKHLPDPENMDRRQRKLFLTSIFLGKLLLAGVFFQAIIFLEPDTYSLQVWLAGLISGILNLTGITAVHSGIDILIGNETYRIIQDCLGWKSKAAFIGLMFASSSLRKHYRFVLAGLAVIFTANIIRILTTVYLSHMGVISFEIIHGTLWRWGLTAVVAVLWLYWFRKNDVMESGRKIASV